MDYALCKRQEEEHVVTLLVIKHRQSRAARCRVVPQKGAFDVMAAEIAVQGIRDLGVTGPVILKTDNEDASIALQRRAGVFTLARPWSRRRPPPGTSPTA